jgi:hypothetical protein
MMSTDDLYLGSDLGGTNLKAMAIAEEGARLCEINRSEGAPDLTLGIGLRAGFLEPMIGYPAARLVECVVTILEGLHKGIEVPHFHAASSLERRDPFVEPGRVVHGQCPVGSERGYHGHGKGRLLPKPAVMPEAFHRIICGAEHPNLHALERGPGPVILCSGETVAPLLDVSCGAPVQKPVVYAEVGLQLQMGPVVERVPEGARSGLCPGTEPVPVGCIPRDESFVHTVPPHGTPLVVIMVQPAGMGSTEQKSLT